MENLKLHHVVDKEIFPSGTCSCISIDGLTPTKYYLVEHTIYLVDQKWDTVEILDLHEENVVKNDAVAVGMEYLADQQLLCLIVSDGSIWTHDLISKQFDSVACISDEIVTSCWSPDYELLVLITKSNEMVLMNRMFEIISTSALNQSDYGTENFVNVGWGKKETQFHGTAGKQAALAQKSGELSKTEWDDGKARISWRGDGQHFCVSSIDPQKGYRIIRVWTREGIHSSTCEAATGVGQSVSWRPSGTLIATSQTKDDICRIIFYERNGLPHGDFTLSLPSCQVLDLAWNRESDILMLLVKAPSDNSCYVQLYTTKNYHWYCKLSFYFAAADAPSAVCWDPDNAYVFYLALRNGICKEYRLSWIVNRTIGEGSSLVAVIDGKNILLSDFAKMVIPPPMCQSTWRVDGFVNQIEFSMDDRHTAACINSVNEVVFRDKILEDDEEAKNASLPLDLIGIKLAENNQKADVYHFRNLCANLYSWISYHSSKWMLIIGGFTGDSFTKIKEFHSTMGIFEVTKLTAGHLAALEYCDGSMKYLTTNFELVSCFPLEKPISSVAHQIEAVNFAEKIYLVSLNSRFQLSINDKQIANNVNSVCLHEEFLLCTTITHKLYCLPFDQLDIALTATSIPWMDMRSLERGSRIITTVNNDAKVVLQMPRGNLETISPRPLVLSMIKRSLDGCNYKDALLIMRRHRINLNLIYDHNPTKFRANISKFIEQVNNATLFNLFISDLSDEDYSETSYSFIYKRETDQAANKREIKSANGICEQFRQALVKDGLERKHASSYIVSLIKMTPPQLDPALRFVREIRDSGSEWKETVEECLRHLFYFVDVNKLFDVALGTYDFDLILMVAERSKKDPKEYVPFLTELRLLEPNYMKFKIDDHLMRYESALNHLFNCGDAKFDEFVPYMKKHKMMSRALRFDWKDNTKYETICAEYADHLTSERRHDEAASMYVLANNKTKAIDAYCRATNWQLALGLAFEQNMPEEYLKKLCSNLSEKLKDQQRFFEAAAIENDFLKNTERSVLTLIEGGYWEEALLKISSCQQPDLLRSKFASSLKVHCEKLLENVTRYTSTFTTHKSRLAVVRTNKQSRLLEAMTKGDFDDTATVTETSSAITKTSAQTGRSSVIRARQTKKQERKRYTLKEGSAYEDMALLKALSEVITYAGQTRDELCKVLPLLIRFNMFDTAQRLQHSFMAFADLIRSSQSEIWPNAVDINLLPGPAIDNIIFNDKESTKDVWSCLPLELEKDYKFKLCEELVAPSVTSLESGWSLSMFK